MKTQRRHDDRSPVPVVAGITNVLHSRSHIDSAPKPCRVIRLQDVLPPVTQAPVAQQKTYASHRKVPLMLFLNPVPSEGHAGPLVIPMPPRSTQPDTLSDGR